LEETDRDLKKAECVFSDEAKESIESLRRRLDEQRNMLSQSQDADARRQVTEQARFVQQELSRLRHSPEHRKTALLTEMNEILTEFNALVRAEASPTVI
jgi:molecular chaperone DnaK